MIFRITITWMKSRKVRIFLSFIVLTIGFMLCGLTLLCANISEYDRIEYSKQCDVTRTGCLAAFDNSIVSFEKDASVYEKGMALLANRPYQQFFNAIKKSGLVEKCALYSVVGNLNVDTDIIEFQRGHQISNYSNMGSVEIIYAQKDIFDIYNINVDEIVDKEDWEPNGIILGYKFKELLGDAQYVDFKNYMETDKSKCKILGYTCENQKLSFEGVAYKDRIALTGLYNLDYAFIQIVPENLYQGNELHYRLSENISKEDFQKKVYELAQKYDTEINSLHFIDEHLAELKHKNMSMLGFVIYFAIGLLLSMVVITIFTKIYSILYNRRVYGIFYSAGLTNTQINALFFAENGLVYSLSFFLAIILLYNWAFIFCNFFGQAPHLIVEVIRSILISRVFVQELGICIGMIVLSSVIPAFVLSALSPVSMMRELYDRQ